MARTVDASLCASWEIPGGVRLILSERDSLKVIDLLADPPAPTERLIRAAKTGRMLD
jgi:uncharacterized protein (DUF1778 family)